MIAIARLAMRGPFAAAACAAVLLIGALGFALLLVPSGAVVALATLRHGPREGLRVVALASALAALARFALAGDAAAMLVVCAVAWLPAVLFATALRQAGRQAVPVLLAAALAFTYALALRIGVGDVDAFWAERLAALVAQIEPSVAARLPAADLANLAARMHPWSLVGVELVVLGTVLLGRYWQAALYNPRGFATEFRALALPRTLLPVMAAAALLDAFAGPPLAGVGADALVILVVSCALQGLAIVHFRAAALGLAAGWLAAFYVALVLLPPVVGPLLATVGLIDGAADFRGLRRRGTDGT